MAKKRTQSNASTICIISFSAERFLPASRGEWAAAEAAAAAAAADGGSGGGRAAAAAAAATAATDTGAV